MRTQAGTVNPQAGVTLVELLVAALLVGLALVPLMQLYPGLLEANREGETEMRLGVAASRKLEDLVAAMRADIDAVSSGAEGCADLPGCRLEWTVQSEQSSPAPGVGALKSVGVRACADADGSLSCDAGEVQVRYDTKVTSRP